MSNNTLCCLYYLSSRLHLFFVFELGCAVEIQYIMHQLTQSAVIVRVCPRTSLLSHFTCTPSGLYHTEMVPPKFSVHKVSLTCHSPPILTNLSHTKLVAKKKTTTVGGKFLV